MRTNRFIRAALVAWLMLMEAPLAGAFELTDTTGQRHRLADYRGRWVVVNFWATWCVPCIQEIPEIAQFAREHPRVAVIGISMDDGNAARVKQFARRVGHDYALVLSDAQVEAQLGTPRALPTTKIYDPAGKLVYDRAGRVTRKSLEDATRSRPPAKA